MDPYGLDNYGSYGPDSPGPPWPGLLLAIMVWTIIEIYALDPSGSLWFGSMCILMSRAYIRMARTPIDLHGLDSCGPLWFGPLWTPMA